MDGVHRAPLAASQAHARPLRSRNTAHHRLSCALWRRGWDTYRTTLWKNGSDEGFNSNPNEILYAYANYKPIHVPLIWSTFLTDFNVVIAVLSMFILLAKSVAFVMHVFIPILSIFTHLVLIAIYAVATRNQASPDLSNTKVPHLSRNLPWYLSKGCSYAETGNYRYCMQARASFAMTCVMLALFCTYLGVAIHSAFITEEERKEHLEEYDEEIELKKYDSQYIDPDHGLTREEKWERNREMFANMPKTPVTPFAGRHPAMTPRTTAFQQLSGAVGIGEELSAVGRPSLSSRGPARPLVFREQYGEGSGVPDAR